MIKTRNFNYFYIIIYFLFYGLYFTQSLFAQSPPTIYVAGDGSGDYNCDGNSDQVQINQALDFVAAHADYTTVYLKGANVFEVDEPVIISSNTILTGDSTAVIYLKDSVNWFVNNKPVIGQKNAASWDSWGNPGDSISNVEIYGFEISGGQQLEPTGDTYIPIIHFYYPYNVSIHDMFLHHSYWDIIRMSTDTDGVKIETKIYNNNIENAGHEGISFVGVTNFEAYDNTIYHTRTNCAIRAKDTDTIFIHNNIIGNSLSKTPSGYVGILVQNGHASIGKAEIYENLIYGKNGGIHLTGDGEIYPIDSRKNVHIHHNRIFKTKQKSTSSGFLMEGGIKIDGFQNTSIEHNVIENCETDGIVYQGTSGGSSGYQTIVKNNIIINNGEYGISNEEGTVNTFVANNNLVYNNTSGNYNNTTSTDDINSDPLYAGTHSTLNTWYHIVATYSNADETFKIYVNGKLHASKKMEGFGSIGTNNKDLYLGSYRGTTTYSFKGRSDDVAIWDKPLTKNDIDALYNNGQPSDISGILTDDLQAYFKMENNWNDSSGNNYNALNSTAGFTNQAFNGNYAGLFDNTKVEYPNNLSTKDGLTISAWVYRTGLDNELQTILNKGNQASNNHIWLYFDDEDIVFELGNGTERFNLHASVLDPVDMDFHLTSQTGRWNGSTWVKDTVTSPCIDKGDTSSVYSNEPLPNGEIVNIGLYGNTIEASKTKLHTYYVSLSGSDSNSGLTIPEAWRNINYAASSASPVTVGDTVFVLEGTYNERIFIEKSGADGNNTVFSNYQDDNVTIDGAGISWGASWNGLIDFFGNDYVELKGFHIKNADYAGIFTDSCSNILIPDNSTYNTFSSGIGIWNSNHIFIENNEVELACNDGEQECITIGNSHHCDILNNKVHDNGPGTNGGEGIDAKEGSHDIKIYQNEVYNLNERIGIYTDAWDKHTYNINIFNNKVHHCGNNGINAQTEMGGLLEYVNIYNNVIYNNKWDGIALGSVTADPNVTITPVKHVKVINNTCYKNGSYQGGWGYGVLVNNDDLQDVTIRNNICSKNSAQIAIEKIDTIQQVDHNLVDGFNDTPYSVYGSDSLVADPLFEDTINFDFHLQDISPAIDFGSITECPEIDLDSVPRPLLANPDLGAYEYGIWWNGSLSNDWHTAGNWSTGLVPVSTDKVTIPSPEFYRYYPKVNTNGQIGALYINENAKFEIMSNKIFDVGL